MSHVFPTVWAVGIPFAFVLTFFLTAWLRRQGRISPEDAFMVIISSFVWPAMPLVGTFVVTVTLITKAWKRLAGDE